MAGSFLHPDLKDPFLSHPASYLLPKTLRPAGPVQALHHSMTPSEKRKLMGEVEAVLGKELDSGVGAPGNDEDGAVVGGEHPKRRRPDLGLKRAPFTLMPDISESAPPQVDAKPNFSQLEDPEEYFDAYERMEFADKEMRKLRGESVLEEQNQNEQVGGARVRRPALQLGRKSSYNLLYPKFSGDLENFPSQNISEDHTFPQFSPKLNILDSHGQKLNSVVDNTSSSMHGTDFQETEIPTDASGRAEGMLGELLVTCKNLDDTQTRNLLQDRLNIKPLVLEKLNLPDLDSIPTIDLKEPEEIDWRTRKLSSFLQSTDRPGVRWNMLVKDQQSTKDAEILSTPPRMQKEAIKVPSSSDKNSASDLRRTLSNLLARKEDKLFFGEKSPASQARIAKETNSPFSSRMETNVRSRSSILPKPLNRKEGVSVERDSGSVRVSLNMNFEQTNVENIREEETGVAKPQNESMTMESRLEVDTLEEGTVSASKNLRDKLFHSGEMHVDKSSEKYDGTTVVENKEEMHNDEVPRHSVSLQPVIPSESCSIGTLISSQGHSEQSTNVSEIELASLGVMEKSNDTMNQNVKETTSPISGGGMKTRGRLKKSKDPLRKHTASVPEKGAPSFGIRPVEEGNLESSEVLREQDPAKIGSEVAPKTKSHPERQNRTSASKRLRLAEKLAATLDTSPAKKRIPESSDVMGELEPARVELNTASKNKECILQQSKKPESNRRRTAAVKEKAQPKVMKKTNRSRRQSLAGYGTSWQGGVRRSTRIRREPLKWWKGERFIYGRIHDTLATVIGVKYTKNDDGKNIEFDLEYLVEEKHKELVDSSSYH